MNSLNKLVITILLALSSNAIAASFNSTSSINTVTLKDETVIFKADILSAHLRLDNSVDFIELKDGSKVEGSEVKSVSFNKPKFGGIQTMGAKKGDGSGG